MFDTIKEYISQSANTLRVLGAAIALKELVNRDQIEENASDFTGDELCQLMRERQSLKVKKELLSHLED